MSHSETYIAHLLLKQVSGELTPEETVVLQEWRAHSADNAQLYDELTQPAGLQSRLREFQEAASQAAQVQAPAVKTTKLVRTYWWRYAAAFLLLLGGTALFLTISRKPNARMIVSKPVEVSPAAYKATLTLADGTVISLDSSSGGTIAQQGNSSIVKMPDGTIRYDKKGAANAALMMNTMSTPKGGQYRLILPDGTIVWLNAASSVTYPAAFAAGSRNIKMTGEAYFEVAQDKAKPFMIEINGEGTAEVLGTAFNINAYKDNGTVKTTLVNGKLRVSTASPSEAVVLLPGQQAIQETHSLQVMNGVDLAQVLAWKNGIFDFNGASFRTLMMEVERWYDVTIKYEGAIPDIRFKGKMDRGIKLSGVIRFLNDYGIHAQLEGHVLIIRGK